jgi:hypothetical protein
MRIGEIVLIELYLDEVVTAYDQEEEVTYYYTESMAIGDAIVKLESFYPEDTIASVEYMLQVSLWDDENANAYKFIFYWDKPPVPLVIRNMVQQITDYQAEACKEVFIEFCKEMSIQYICSGDQDTEEHEESIIDDVNFDLTILGTKEARDAITFLKERE